MTMIKRTTNTSTQSKYRHNNRIETFCNLMNFNRFYKFYKVLFKKIGTSFLQSYYSIAEHFSHSISPSPKKIIT